MSKSTPNKQNALGSQSVAESSIAFVIFSAGILITVFAVSAIIWFSLLDKGSAPETQRHAAVSVVWGLWALLSFMLWRGMLLRMRRTPDLDLSEDGFFKFQLASAVCIFAFWLLLRFIPNDIPGFMSSLRLVFEVLFALFTIVYLSFAWGTRKTVPIKIYFGLLINIAVIVAARLR